jgi:DNA polymerase
MNNRREIIKELKKAMEFYQELGFEQIPVKKSDLVELLANTLVIKKQNDERPSYQVSEKVGAYASNKEGALKDLQREISDCQQCRLSKERKNIVFGEGNPNAELMFIGEGPGREEDLQARPFVGNAGKLLTSLIKKMGLKREDVYIANIVKCRPPSNRDPEEDEMTTCSPFLEKQIEIIQPRVIIALGRISAQSLLGSKIPISKLRGKFYSYKDIPVMPTFHPAYLMRNPKDKWLTWEDAQQVLEKLKKNESANR